MRGPRDFFPTLARGVLLAAASVLAGCVPRETGTVHLRASFWSPPGIEEEIARRFEATHPGVKIDLLITGGRYAEKLQAMLVAGTEPDVMMVHDTFFADWATRGALMGLTDFVAGLDREDPFFKPALSAMQWHGRTYGVPVEANAIVTYGNLDATAAAHVPFPWRRLTWTQLAELGPRFSRRDNPSSPTDYLCALPPPPYFFVTFGGRCFDDLHHPRAVIVDAPLTVAALDYWRLLHQRGWAVPRSTVLDQGESEMFRDGRIAFTFWGRSASRIIRGNPARRFDLAPAPEGPAGPAVALITGGVGLSPRTRHAALAREYLRFYAAEAGRAVPLREAQIAPVRRSLAQSPLLLAQHPPAATPRYVEPLERGIATAVAYCPGRLTIEDIVTKRFEQALAEPARPSREIAAGLAADLRRWLADMQTKGLL